MKCSNCKKQFLAGRAIVDITLVCPHCKWKGNKPRKIYFDKVRDPGGWVRDKERRER